jgi:hypothetical protein
VFAVAPDLLFDCARFLYLKQEVATMAEKPPSGEASTSSSGPMLAAIVLSIAVGVLLGGVYAWHSQTEREAEQQRVAEQQQREARLERERIAKEQEKSERDARREQLRLAREKERADRERDPAYQAEQSRRQQQREEQNLQVNVGSLCQVAIKRRLNDPDAAKFDFVLSYRWVQQTNNRVLMFPTLRAKNAFGAYIKATFVCEVDITDRENPRLRHLEEL